MWLYFDFKRKLFIYWLKSYIIYVYLSFFFLDEIKEKNNNDMLNERQDNIKRKQKRQEYRWRTSHRQTTSTIQWLYVHFFFSVTYVRKALFYTKNKRKQPVRVVVYLSIIKQKKYHANQNQRNRSYEYSDLRKTRVTVQYERKIRHQSCIHMYVCIFV